MRMGKLMDTMRQIILLIATLIFVTAALVAPSSAAANANIVITMSHQLNFHPAT